MLMSLGLALPIAALAGLLAPHPFSLAGLGASIVVFFTVWLLTEEDG